MNFPCFLSQVSAMDERKLSLEKLQNMQNLLPTREELSVMASYKGEGTNGLGRAEQFFLSVTKHPKFKQKLDIFIFTLSFDEQLDDLKSSLTLLKNACCEVMQSKSLASLLHRLLAIGNLINTRSGNSKAKKASGIKLDSLIKTAKRNGSDGKILLDVIIETIMKQKQTASQNIDFWEDMPNARSSDVKRIGMLHLRIFIVF